METLEHPAEKADIRKDLYAMHSFFDMVVSDPFMGLGTTIGEAHKLGFTALGHDINPVAVEAVKTALGSPIFLPRMPTLSANIEYRLLVLS